jgi:hypothetical protein
VPGRRGRWPPAQPLVDAPPVERVPALGEQPELVAVRVVRLAHRAPRRRVAGRIRRPVFVVKLLLFAVLMTTRRREHQRRIRDQDGLVQPAPAELHVVAQRVAPLRRRLLLLSPARAEEGGGRDHHQRRHGGHDQQHVFGHDAQLASSIQHVACCCCTPSLHFYTRPCAEISATTTTVRSASEPFAMRAASPRRANQVGH